MATTYHERACRRRRKRGAADRNRRDTGQHSRAIGDHHRADPLRLRTPGRDYAARPTGFRTATELGSPGANFALQTRTPMKSPPRRRRTAMPISQATSRRMRRGRRRARRVDAQRRRASFEAQVGAQAPSEVRSEGRAVVTSGTSAIATAARPATSIQQPSSRRSRATAFVLIPRSSLLPRRLERQLSRHGGYRHFESATPPQFYTALTRAVHYHNLRAVI